MKRKKKKCKPSESHGGGEGRGRGSWEGGVGGHGYNMLLIHSVLWLKKKKKKKLSKILWLFLKLDKCILSCVCLLCDPRRGQRCYESDVPTPRWEKWAIPLNAVWIWVELERLRKDETCTTAIVKKLLYFWQRGLNGVIYDCVSTKDKTMTGRVSKNSNPPPNN